MNADILIRGGATQEDLIDEVMGSRVYVPAFIAVNKVDLIDNEQADEIEGTLEERFSMPPVMISAHTGYHMEELKEEIYQKLGFMRLYLRPQGEEADLEEPLIIRSGSTVEAVCRKLHRDFVDRFRYARVWGDHVKHPGQRIGLPYKLHDGDILSIIIEH